LQFQFNIIRMKTLFTLLALAATVVILSSFGGDDNSDYPGGAPAGYTGSPGDGSNCTACHNGSASNVSGWITSTVPADGYTPGSTYTVTVTLTGSGYKGFEVSPQTVSGALLGTLTAGANNHLTGSGKYVTHNARSSANPATWSFTWTAPAAGTGSVTFYGAFCVSKPVTKLSTLVVAEYIPPVPLAVTASATPSLICSGQSSQLNAQASGGSGNYTYSWTSNPSGYSSNIANPVVNPAVTTQFIVTVTDGTQNATDNTNVTVTQPPTAFAGNDTTYNINLTQIDLHGAANNFTSVIWSTWGDGTFVDAGVLNAVYSLGAGDKEAGSVSLTLTATPLSPCANNVSSDIHILLESGTGIAGHVKGLAISISPNPSHGIIYMINRGIKEMDASLVLYNTTGQVMNNEMMHLSAGTPQMKDLSSLAKGIYFLKIQSDSGITTRKIILE
jgi:hypothetical protein